MKSKPMLQLISSMLAFHEKELWKEKKKGKGEEKWIPVLCKYLQE